MKKNLLKTLSVILAVVLMFSANAVFVFADNEKATRTEMLDLNDPQFETDCENAEEGWSWDAETNTLTLNGFHLDMSGKEDDGINLKENVSVTIKTIGENSITSDNRFSQNISRHFSGGVIFTGDGVLNLYKNGVSGLIDVGGMTLESGTINAVGADIWSLGQITINGGTLNIDTLDYEGCDGLYVLDNVVINGGKVDIKANRTAIFVDGTSDYDSLKSDRGLIIKGGDVSLYGGVTATWVGYDETCERETIIDTDGTVTIHGSEQGFGMYCGGGSIEVKRGKINNPDNLELDMLFYLPDGEAIIHGADYSKVDAAIAKIPKKLSDYTEESAAAVQAAVNAVERDLSVLEQEKVDKFASDIEAALENLEEDLCWLVKVFRAIVNFFKTVFNFLFGWIVK